MYSVHVTIVIDKVSRFQIRICDILLVSSCEHPLYYKRALYHSDTSSGLRLAVGKYLYSVSVLEQSL